MKGPESEVLGPLRGHDFASVEDRIGGIVLARKAPRAWTAGIAVALLLLLGFLYGTTYLLAVGVGIWGVNAPVGWGFAIINFVWWIGIGHAGTLISAILLLLRQPWRTSINRLAEAMTLFAVACAATFPALHLGRPWLFYWLVPYPDTMGLWPQFRSPLVWDIFAVSTYGIVSLLFWFVGLVPDLAAMRDRARGRAARMAFGVLAMGWRGSAEHWRSYETAYLLLAGLATPLVVSVHTVVSFDFAVSVIPGWHSTIFPPYFVAGAIFSGFGMVLCLVIPLRRLYRLEDFITDKHLDAMAKLLLASGLIVAYGYGMEAFMAWYGGGTYEVYAQTNRFRGPYAPTYWSLLVCNVLVPQLLWSRRVRRAAWALFAISLIVLAGMWLERFVIVVTSLHRDFLPSSWGMYAPTRWDWVLLVGSLGLFGALMFVFVRLLPMISIFEVRASLPQAHVERGREGGQ
ncbi:MAG: polysulfide reductase NrfD [Deltaproteobacteria bacterium]|nr:polysulfide reductase NrfD [Deltaproteobacteria bacterium]